MVAYFKKVMADHQGSQVEWRQCISASPSLDESDRKRHWDLWDKYLALCNNFRDSEVPLLERLRYYLMFFDVRSFAPTKEQLAALPV